MTKQRINLLASVMLTVLVLSSCSQINNEDKRLITDILDTAEPIDVVDKYIEFSDYDGGPIHKQIYTLSMYRDSSDFSDIYGSVNVEKVVFDCSEYESLGLVGVYNEFMFFHVIKGGTNYIMRYNMDTGLSETVFVYEGDYQMAFSTANEDYLIWKEDENANWTKVSLHCHNFKTGEDRMIFTYSRSESTGKMYSWNFNEVILKDDKVYFDNVEKIIDGASSINLYEYDIKNDCLKVVSEHRAAEPIRYGGLSWISFNEDSEEYVIKNKDGLPDIVVGDEYVKLYASEKLLVGYINETRKNGLMYYNGKDTIPVIRSTKNIDSIHCTDLFITWDGWSNDIPLFYDVKKDMIVKADFVEEGLRYAGIVSDDYLIFAAHEFIHDPSGGEDDVTTQSLIYYLVKTDDLQ